MNIFCTYIKTAFEKPYVCDVHDIGQRAQVVSCQWEYFSISCILHEILLNHRIKKKKQRKKRKYKINNIYIHTKKKKVYGRTNYR